MYRYLILSFLLALFTLPLSSQPDETDYSEAFRLIEAWLEAQKDYEQLPGISAAVVRDQEIIWSDAFGKANREQNLDASPSTLCSICSISKLFTSVAVMKLYDEGKVRLDDRIEDLLPWYDLPQQYKDSGPVTIRSLLTHSSGLPRESAHPYWTGPDFPFPTQKEIRDGLSTQETLYPSSTNYQYSNLGLTLLGEVVEEISGMSYAEYVQKNILDPLGLADTRPRMPEELYGKQLAVGYSSMTRNGNREKVNFFQANGITPAAGYSSNVLDLGKFASWQFRLYDTSLVEILKPSTLKYMHRVQWMDEPGRNGSRGLGFGVYKVDGTTFVGHGGSCPGYSSVLQLDTKKKMAYAAMINASGTNPGKYTSGIRQIMQKVKKAKKDDDSTPTVNLEQYAGHYSAQPWWGEEYIMPWGDQLVSLGLPSDNPGEAMTFFKHIEGDTFRRIRDDDTLGEALIFERDANGHVISVSQHGNYSVKIKK
jgi:CubicO group peptidase (beta-lactamase class C family)